jgi:glycosyltransferase involved in cell wall biosynthesis
MLAGFFRQVPIRIGIIHGIRFETTLGFKRKISWIAEKITALCSHRIICVSDSVKRKMNDFCLAKQDRMYVPGHGSVNGLNSSRFQLNSEVIRQSLAIRQKYSIPPGVPMIGFVGRIVRDKGIIELIESYKKILVIKPETRLMIVGPNETGDPIPKECAEWLGSHPHVILTGNCTNVVPYYNLFDLLVLPSYREGFGVVVLEAVAMGVPTIGFNATGIVDSIVDGETGMIVPMKDSEALADAILKYLEQPKLRFQHGLNGRKRVVRDFQPPMLWEDYYQEYSELLRLKNIPVPGPEVEPESSVLIDPEEDMKEFVKWFAAREVVVKNRDISDVFHELDIDETEIRALIEQC